MKEVLWLDDDIFYLFWGYISSKNLKEKRKNDGK
jgi:hypothetical protein